MTGPYVPPHPVVDPDRLAALDAYGFCDLGPETGFDGIVLLARTLCAAPAALISFVGDDCQWFAARTGFGPARTPLSQSICAHALERPGLLVIPDLTTDPRTRDNALVTGPTGLQFYAGAPLRTVAGQPLGTLCVLDTRPRPGGLSEEEAEGLRTLASQVMVQLELRRELMLAQCELASLANRPPSQTSAPAS